MRASPSPSPLLLDQRSVDALYVCLEGLQAALQQLQIPFVLIAGSLLGAVRSRSLLFCDDDVDVAVFEEDYPRVLELLPERLGKAHTFSRRPWPGADRVRPRACPQVWIDVFVLRRFVNVNELRAAVKLKDNGQPQSREYVRECLEAAATAAEYPIWHYDARKAVELWPREFLTRSELFPLRHDLSFGPLRSVACPAQPLSYLRRAYGNDCLQVYRVADSHLAWSSEVRARWEHVQRTSAVPLPPAGVPAPLEEQHYAPLPHSKRPSCCAHSRELLAAFVAAEDAARVRPNHFGACIAAFTAGSRALDMTDASLRSVIEPHLEKARTKRDAAIAALGDDATARRVLAGNVAGSELTAAFARLCREGDSVYSVAQYPLREALAEALQLPAEAADFCQFHFEGPGAQGVSKKEALAGLLDAARRERFHRVYDCFVREVCVSAQPP